MTIRLALSLCGLMLAASLALKLTSDMDRAMAAASVRPGEAAALLERHGFQVSEGNPDSDLIWVSGIARGCRVLIASVSPRGWHRSVVTQVAAGNQLFYAFGGKLYPEQPIVWTRAHYYWSKLCHYLRLSVPRRPVLAVVASPICETVPLDDLAKLSGR